MQTTTHLILIKACPLLCTKKRFQLLCVIIRQFVITMNTTAVICHLSTKPNQLKTQRDANQLHANQLHATSSSYPTFSHPWYYPCYATWLRQPLRLRSDGDGWLSKLPHCILLA